MNERKRDACFACVRACVCKLVHMVPEVENILFLQHVKPAMLDRRTRSPSVLDPF